MFVTRVEDIERMNVELSRRSEKVTLILECGTIETVLRNLRGDPHLDVMYESPLPKNKQKQVVQAAIDDIGTALQTTISV